MLTLWGTLLHRNEFLKEVCMTSIKHTIRQTPKMTKYYPHYCQSENTIDSTELEEPCDDFIRLFNIDKTKYVLSLMENVKVTRKIQIAKNAHKQQVDLILKMESLETNCPSPRLKFYQYIKQPSIVESEFKFRKHLKKQGLLINCKAVTIESQSEHKFVSGKIKIIKDNRDILLVDIQQVLFNL